MDESTSAFDEAGQADLMGLFQNELAGTSLVSIAHRAGVDAFHDRILTLVMAVGGARLVTKRRLAAPKRGKAATKPSRTPRKGSLATAVLRRFRSAG